MTRIHLFIGWAVPTGFGVLALWSLWALVRNRPPGGGYWNLLGALQGILGLQVIAGAILFLLGGRPNSNGPVWLHYVYGGLFPAVLLVVAHRYAKRYADIPFVVFGIAALVICGLTVRALMTGLGVD